MVVSFKGGVVDTVSSLLDVILSNARSFGDTLNSRVLLAKFLASQEQYACATRGVLDILSNLGESFPTEITESIVVDEINEIVKGKNFGWPVITYGINYSGTPITDKTKAPNMEQPFYYWVPSIAPSGMTFSTSGIYPEWRDNLFIGSLKFEYLERLVIEGSEVTKREKILDKVGRVRNVKEGPDGYLYLGVEGKGILRIIPKK